MQFIIAIVVLFAGAGLLCLMAEIFGVVFGKRKPTTLTTLPPEPTDWITIDTDKGNWWDGIHEMD
jgi:hypothetical protein